VTKCALIHRPLADVCGALTGGLSPTQNAPSVGGAGVEVVAGVAKEGRRHRDYESRRRQRCRDSGPDKAEWATCSNALTCLPVEILVAPEIRTPTADELNDPRQLSLAPRNDWDKYLTPDAVAAMDAAEASVEAPEGMQLPECPDTMRVIPSALLRSALFGVVRRGGRRHINGETLTSWKGASIRYKGEQLDQYDLDVWLQVLHIVRAQSFRVARAHFTARGFLRALGRKYSGAAAKVLFESMERMVACAVTVMLNGRSFTGSLVEEIYRDGEKYVVRLNPKLCRLFDAGHTRLSWDTRLALPTDFAR
jgi:hypothetical protein